MSATRVVCWAWGPAGWAGTDSAGHSLLTADLSCHTACNKYVVGDLHCPGRGTQAREASATECLGIQQLLECDCWCRHSCLQQLLCCGVGYLLLLLLCTPGHCCLMCRVQLLSRPPSTGPAPFSWPLWPAPGPHHSSCLSCSSKHLFCAVADPMYCCKWSVTVTSSSICNHCEKSPAEIGGAARLWMLPLPHCHCHPCCNCCCPLSSSLPVSHFSQHVAW